MARLHNPTDTPLAHEICRKEYKLQPGETVEFADELVPFLPLGSLMKLITSGAPSAKEAQKPDPAMTAEATPAPKSDAPAPAGLTDEQKRQLAARGAK